MRTITLNRPQTAQGPLILVNAAHPLADAPGPELSPPDELRPQILLERQAARLLDACIRTTGGWQAIVPVSGWRSLEEQRRIWADTWDREGEGFTRKYVALPRCSEHQTGLAIDLAQAAEHIDFIRPHFPSCSLPNGRQVTVSYLPCPGEEAELAAPENTCLQISGSNDGAFIVTA